MKNINWRDLARGLLIGLIAGVGWVLAYKILILFTMETPWARHIEAAGWFITFPVLWLLFNYFSKRAKDTILFVEPVEPVESVEEGDDIHTDEPVDRVELDGKSGVQRESNGSRENGQHTE